MIHGEMRYTFIIEGTADYNAVCNYQYILYIP